MSVEGFAPAGTLSREDQLRLGIWSFLATVTMLFAAFASAYVVRRSGADWRPAALPGLLWINTGVLGISSLIVELANRLGRQRRWKAAARACAAALAVGLVFLGGQMLVWRQMLAAGLYLSSNPYSSFVYMMTGAHAAHVAAAIVVLAWGAWMTRRGAADPRRWAARMDVCRSFWHYLGAVWVLLFALVSMY